MEYSATSAPSVAPVPAGVGLPAGGLAGGQIVVYTPQEQLLQSHQMMMNLTNLVVVSDQRSKEAALQQEKERRSAGPLYAAGTEAYKKLSSHYEALLEPISTDKPPAWTLVRDVNGMASTLAASLTNWDVAHPVPIWQPTVKALLRVPQELARLSHPPLSFPADSKDSSSSSSSAQSASGGRNEVGADEIEMFTSAPAEIRGLTRLLTERYHQEAGHKQQTATGQTPVEAFAARQVALLEGNYTGELENQAKRSETAQRKVGRILSAPRRNGPSAPLWSVAAQPSDSAAAAQVSLTSSLVQTVSYRVRA